MHKQIQILVRILVLHYIFFTICYSQQDTLNNNRRKEVQARIDLINQLIKEKGYKWKAGFNSLSYYDDYQLAKLCGEKSEASKVELNLIKQDMPSLLKTQVELLK